MLRKTKGGKSKQKQTHNLQKHKKHMWSEIKGQMTNNGTLMKFRVNSDIN
jgi:hypothetical protein